MDNLTQKDPAWRENGKAFVESVTRLLERLLDYRNVGQVGILRYFCHHQLIKSVPFFALNWPPIRENRPTKTESFLVPHFVF